MPFTLIETFHQIDPYVQLNDGHTVSTVAQWVMTIDPTELTEYSLEVDGVGRFLIYRLDSRGRRIHPPAFVEHKAKLSSGTSDSDPLGSGSSYSA